MWTYLYRAVDSAGDTIDFLLSPYTTQMLPNASSSKHCIPASHPRPRVINVDKNAAYPKAVEKLKRTRELGQPCRCRPVRLSQQCGGAGPSGN
jgi:transposase-like protein